MCVCKQLPPTTNTDPSFPIFSQCWKNELNLSARTAPPTSRPPQVNCLARSLSEPPCISQHSITVTESLRTWTYPKESFIFHFLVQELQSAITWSKPPSFALNSALSSFPQDFSPGSELKCQLQRNRGWECQGVQIAASLCGQLRVSLASFSPMLASFSFMLS